jgi:DNA-binding MarR family transcriptional regulator
MIDRVAEDSEAAPPAQPEKTTPPAEPRLRLGILDGLLGYHLRRAQLAAFQSFAETMDRFGISPGQFGVLALVDANPGLNQTALGRALGIERSSVVAVLDRLEKRRLLRRAKHDRRSHALYLTPEGKELLGTVRPLLEAHERRIAADLSRDETRTLIALLRRVGAG